MYHPIVEERLKQAFIKAAGRLLKAGNKDVEEMHVSTMASILRNFSYKVQDQGNFTIVIIHPVPGVGINPNNVYAGASKRDPKDQDDYLRASEIALYRAAKKAFQCGIIELVRAEKPFDEIPF
jgi:hypothetical protein